MSNIKLCGLMSELMSIDLKEGFVPIKLLIVYKLSDNYAEKLNRNKSKQCSVRILNFN